MDTVLKQVRRTIEQYRLLSPGETVVVGVSGGPDSLCLLHVLCRLGGEYGLALQVAHLHHGLRGPDADADAEFVRALAADWGLPCTVERTDVPALARGQRLAFEEAARRARYTFLSQVASDTGAKTIAVGHNADDQAETILMHWLRGSGLAGLRGMLPSTQLTDYRLLTEDNPRYPIPNIHLIRPLLEIPRTEIEAYCAFHDLEPCFDRSNLDTTYFRNWLRHEVLPLLARHNPNVRAVIRRSGRVIADDYALLRSLLDETWPQVVVEEISFRPDSPEVGAKREGIVFDLAAWRALPTSLQRSMLREAIHRLRRSLRNINFIHVENALFVARDGATGDQATLPRGLMLTVDYDRFVIADVDVEATLPDLPLLPLEGQEVPVRVPGDTRLPGSDWVLHAEVVAHPDLPADWQANRDPWRAFFDARVCEEALLLRTRRPGERFWPLGMGGHTVKLGDFLTNQKVPQNVRNRLPLLVGAEEQRIIWVCGQRMDEQAQVRDATEEVLVLRFVRCERLASEDKQENDDNDADGDDSRHHAADNPRCEAQNKAGNGKGNECHDRKNQE